MTPPLTEEDLRHVRNQNAILTLAMKQHDGNGIAAAFALFILACELSADCGIDQLFLSNQLFDTYQERADRFLRDPNGAEEP